jgi:hypothetical protein
MEDSIRRKDKPSLEVWNRFWARLDEDPAAGRTMRHMLGAGCDPQEIAWVLVHFVRRDGDELVEERRRRGRATKRALTAGIKGARKAAQSYNHLVVTYGVSSAPLADVARMKSLVECAKDLEGKLAKCDEAFNTKKEGVEAYWHWLVHLQEYARAVAGEGLSSQQLADLVKAMRYALGLKWDGGDKNGKLYVDAESIRKGIQNFRKRNPQRARLLEERFSRQYCAPGPGNPSTNSAETK